MMLAGIAATPVSGGDLASDSLEVGEVVPPVVAFTDDDRGIIPIVVADAIRREVDIAQRGLSLMRAIIAYETLPVIFLPFDVFKDFLHDGFGAVSHVLQHFSKTAFE